MKLIKRQDVPLKPLPGRVLQLVVGSEGAASSSDVMTMGFARYAAEAGTMTPHRHAEEIVYVLRAQDGWVRHGGFGDQPDELSGPVPLEPGMTLHFPENEWHVFEFDEGGHVEILFFYGQSNIYSRK